MNDNIFNPFDDEEKVLMEAIENDDLIPIENETEFKEKIQIGRASCRERV